VISAGTRADARLAVTIGALALLIGAEARAQTPAPSPSPSSSRGPSMTKTFVIEPAQSDQTFMCETGGVQSVLAFAVGEHRIVSLVYVDKAGASIPDNIWSEAFGFRLLHRQTFKIEAAMTCGG
jgi:hypothetical protein